MANDMTSRMPKFMPNHPGFHRYNKEDRIAQDYLKYVPKIFKPEKYIAIWTNPNGRKYPLCYTFSYLEQVQVVCLVLIFLLKFEVF